MVASRRPPKRTTLHLTEAAERLGMHRVTLYRMCRRGVFTVIRGKGGAAIGQRAFLRMDEVELFDETRDEQRVLDLRYKLRRLNKSA